ncbi:MAG TPA: hypothetical protein VN493_20315 [Thermoanaerobaculia bacterium]|nr:hypothetical protein [Thermoanaerobaculia bacterium]
MRRLLFVLIAALVLVPEAQAQQRRVPAQFIAKTYTEAFGRTPNPEEWLSAVSWFRANGCRAATLGAWGRKVYLSNDYVSLGYDPAAELLTLYRGVLNREPDAPGFSERLSARQRGQRWSDTVDSFFSSKELRRLSKKICGSEPGYSFGDRPVINLPVSGPGFQGTGTQLQAVLDAAPARSTVWLAQKAVIRLNAPLTIPPGVTLATTDTPGPGRYALMARLVRTARFKTAAVSLQSGARLRNVWVDGQRGVVGFTDDGVNVRLLGGDGTGITDSVITNAAGWSSVQAFGRTEGFPCQGNVIFGNLITAYSSQHVRGKLQYNPWTDGLSISCEDTVVQDNQIVDATDVAIVLFRAHPAVQKSQIRYNRILAAGNSAYGAITIDGLQGRGTKPDFQGAAVHDNTFWTGPSTHFDIGLAVGTRAWFGPPADTASGVSVTNNTTAGIPTRVDSGIAISGMLDAYVAGNELNLVMVDVSRCPTSTGPDSPKTVRIGASVAAGHASGDLQPYTDALYDWCIGH